MSIEENKQLSLRQLHALPFILANPSLTQASKESGVSEKQIWEWMNQDHFRKEVILRKNNLISEVTKKLQQSSIKACDTLIDLLNNGKTDTIKHRAAVDLLNLASKFTQTYEIECRIQNLESNLG